MQTKEESESYHQLYVSASAAINTSAQSMSAVTSSKTGLRSAFSSSDVLNAGVLDFTENGQASIIQVKCLFSVCCHVP